MRSGALLVDMTFGAAALYAVFAGRGQPQRCEKTIDRVDLSTRHHRQRTAEQAVQIVQQRHQRRRHFDRFRRLGNGHERAVEIQEEGGVGGKAGG